MNERTDKYYQKLDKEVMKHQDWEPVILNKKREKKEKTKKVLSQSQQRDNKLLKKAEKDELKHDKVPQDLRTKIIQTRASLKWKQKDLAQKCNFPVTVINEIESGKAIYNPQHINKIKRVLKI